MMSANTSFRLILRLRETVLFSLHSDYKNIAIRETFFRRIVKREKGITKIREDDYAKTFQENCEIYIEPEVISSMIYAIFED